MTDSTDPKVIAELQAVRLPRLTSPGWPRRLLLLPRPWRHRHPCHIDFAPQDPYSARSNTHHRHPTVLRLVLGDPANANQPDTHPGTCIYFCHSAATSSPHIAHVYLPLHTCMSLSFMYHPKNAHLRHLWHAHTWTYHTHVPKPLCMKHLNHCLLWPILLLMQDSWLHRLKLL